MKGTLTLEVSDEELEARRADLGRSQSPSTQAGVLARYAKAGFQRRQGGVFRMIVIDNEYEKQHGSRSLILQNRATVDDRRSSHHRFA